MTKTRKIQTVILGASGYTGAELVRYLLQHPHVEIKALTGNSQAGKKMGEVYAHLAFANLPDLITHEQVDYTDIDLVFCCLPHGTTQDIIAKLPEHVRVIDLSADFRLHDLDAYAHWYGHAHQAPDLQKDAVYGLAEFAREQIKAARLVANPGCYPTCSLLSLLPLVQAGLIDTSHITINALSGVSGAGRSAKQNLLLCEASETVRAYGVGHHRHMAEIEQELSQAANEAVTISFTPHLVPMRRGMLATTRVKLVDGKMPDHLRETLSKRYENEPFVKVLDAGAPSPGTEIVSGTNLCVISVNADRVPGYALVISVIDNLGKGAASQAVQNMNIAFGLEETTGLTNTPTFP